MISDERLQEVAGLGSESLTFPPSHYECADMAKELLALRKESLDGVAVAAGVYTMLGISGYSPSETGRAQEKLMSRAGQVLHKAQEDNVHFDWYARWMN